MLRRRTIGSKKLVFFQKRFYPAGNYTWTVPAGCMWVDVFLVGGGCGGNRGYSDTGGAGGYTKTFKKDTSGWRDGDAIPVIPGQSISIRVGKGSSRSSNSTPPNDGGYSQFLNSNYRAYGGSMDGPWRSDGGSGSGGGGSIGGNGGSDGSNGSNGSAHKGGIGQGHTTRDFGESSGKRNAAGGGGGGVERYGKAGVSDYTEGKGSGVNGGGGYGGGGGSAGNGGDGTVLIRYWAYEE